VYITIHNKLFNILLIKDNLSQIKYISNQKKIENLFHFTMFDYLPEILKEGLYSRTKLRKEKTGKYKFTDNSRLDGKTSRISISISHPNWKMFYYKRINLYDAEGWAILELDPKILWELDCWFLPKNAASSSAIMTRKSSSFESFNDMFSGSNRSTSFPSNWTTDVQAEVMVKNLIHPKYIKKVVVENSMDMLYCQKICNSNIEIVVDKKLFGPRKVVC